MSEMYTAILRNAVGKNTPNCMLQDQKMVWVPIRLEHIVLLKMNQIVYCNCKILLLFSGTFICSFTITVACL